MAVGFSQSQATQCANLMAQADLMGQDGHGVFRLPQYINRINQGGLNTNPDIQVIENRTAMALLDGDNGMGHLVMSHATELAIVEKDMIGIYVAVGSANHLPPWGGTEMLLSTNPIAVAIPSNENPPIVLDMATTVAAYGKVKTAAQRGEQMPEGWMIDRQGNPLTDPSRASEGFLLPIGGPKGYGLSLVFGILAGTLNGANFGRDVVDFNADSKSTTNTGHFVIVLDIEAFADPSQFKAGIDKVWEEMKSSPTLPGIKEIRVPGERLAKVKQQNRKNGIPISDALQTTLLALAKQLNVAPLFSH